MHYYAQISGTQRCRYESSSNTNKKSKGLGFERAYNRVSNEIRQDFAHCDQDNDALTDNYKDLLSIASENTQLVLDIFARNDELKAENRRLQQQNEEYRIREEEKRVVSFILMVFNI